MSIYGDIVPGAQITSPGAGAELVATASGDLDGLTDIDVRFMINTTLAGVFTYGLYEADGTPVKTVTISVGANSVSQPEWNGLRPTDGQKLRIVCVNQLLTAVVQTSINYS